MCLYVCNGIIIIIFFETSAEYLTRRRTETNSMWTVKAKMWKWKKQNGFITCAQMSSRNFEFMDRVTCQDR